LEGDKKRESQRGPRINLQEIAPNNGQARENDYFIFAEIAAMPVSSEFFTGDYTSRAQRRDFGRARLSLASSLRFATVLLNLGAASLAFADQDRDVSAHSRRE
jgi:hypothetical protein